MLNSGNAFCDRCQKDMRHQRHLNYPNHILHLSKGVIQN